jgi:hypothetical protein|tara:strand:- start:330 stop:542 length:213 start_codon:yes stop_codon:yes gene_type:complete
MAKKKQTAKKAEPKKTAKKAEPKPEAKVEVAMVEVLRFNVKNGERYKMTVPETEVLGHINGDIGLKDIIL